MKYFINRCVGNCTMGAMRRFYTTVMGPELQEIKLGLQNFQKLEEGQRETKEELAKHKTQLAEHGSEIQNIDKETMRIQRESASFMVRIKGNNFVYILREGVGWAQQKFPNLKYGIENSFCKPKV